MRLQQNSKVVVTGNSNQCKYLKTKYAKNKSNQDIRCVIAVQSKNYICGAMPKRKLH
ncbi:hypothetical protein Syun_003613 [Stephania yunnanensis]|uniref:Uncharacterized protein n=1 Tax=Stephania yunnanensis TaxID=152371 RepID=A0AAP0L1M2_9MAGN